MLARRTGPDRKKFVTTRPAAWPPDKIRKRLGGALALARRIRVSWSRSRSARHPRSRLLPMAFAITPTLRTPPFFALRAGPIVLTGMPTPPASGRVAATLTTVAHLGMARPEPAFTALQETAAWSKPTPRPLIGGTPRWILTWAHGRLYSRRSSLGEEWRLVSEAFLLAHRQLPSAYPPGRHQPIAASTSTGRENGKVRGRH
jgi:hypothetical protein